MGFLKRSKFKRNILKEIMELTKEDYKKMEHEKEFFIECYVRYLLSLENYIFPNKKQNKKIKTIEAMIESYLDDDYINHKNDIMKKINQNKKKIVKQDYEKNIDSYFFLLLKNNTKLKDQFKAYTNDSKWT
ncbi:MAG: hypothetical protein GQ557_02115 [Mycoplasmataceae bacterium]|nr:hypothetical protein [Mycoplasmataceae bacterium]